MSGIIGGAIAPVSPYRDIGYSADAPRGLVPIAQDPATGALMGRGEALGAGVFSTARKASIGIPMWDCSTLTGYSAPGGTMTLVDSPEVSAKLRKQVAKSIQVVIPAGTNVDLSLPVIPAQQNPNSSLAVVIEYVSGPSTPPVVNTFLGVEGSYTNFFLASQQLNQYGRVNVLLNDSSIPVGGGTPTYSTITRGRIRVTATTSPVTVIVHGVYYVQSTPPAVCFIHDDGDVTALTELGVRLNAYGWKAGFSIISDLIDTGGPYMSSSQIAALYADGHDLIPHGQFALSSYGTVAQALADIKKNTDYLKDRGYVRGQKLYVYPNGVYEYSTSDRFAITNYLESNGVIAGYAASGGPFHPMGGNALMTIPRIAIDAATVSATLLTNLDRQIACGRSVNLMVHQIVASGATGANANRAVLDEVMAGIRTRELAGSLRVLAPTEMLSVLGVL